MEIQDDMNNEKESTESLYLSRDEAKSDINKYSISTPNSKIVFKFR